MLHAGLDLSRKRLDVCLLSDQGELVEQTQSPPDLDGLRSLARRLGRHEEPIRGAIESMTGARFVHDTLEDLGWDVLIADAEKVKPFGSVACKTDKVDSQVLARLSQLALIPEIWLPDPRVREERELTRYRMHLVKHRSTLKHRIHATLMTFGRPCPVTDLFGKEGRALLDRLEVPEPWRTNVTASLELMDELDRKIDECNARLEAGHADHPYVPLLRSGAGDRQGARVHDRLRDRRDLSLCVGQAPDRLLGPLPEGQPIRRLRPPRPADQERTSLPALGSDRGNHARLAPPRLLRALPAKQAPLGQAARRQGRPDRHRPKADRRDLAHAEPQ